MTLPVMAWLGNVTPQFKSYITNSDFVFVALTSNDFLEPMMQCEGRSWGIGKKVTMSAFFSCAKLYFKLEYEVNLGV